MIWLRHGHREDTHTDGHVDGVCTYVRPASSSLRPGRPREYRTRADGREPRDPAGPVRRGRAGRLEVIDLPQLPYFDLDGEELMASYANLYVANGGVVVPIADHPLDAEALATIASAFPDREVVGVPSRIISYGGGGPHCITQQVPLAGVAS